MSWALLQLVGILRVWWPRWWTRAGGVCLLLLLSGCGPPASLKSRPGYWADQSIHAQATNHRVRFLVLHYTDGTLPRALHVLTGPKVSSHYLVAPTPPVRAGRPVVRQLVAENERAWHAGVSSWAGRHHINDSSIGIEIVNAGPFVTRSGIAWHSYDGQQIAALTRLAGDIVARYDIAPQNIVGHSDVSPGRKIDPGPAFPWRALYRNGIGAWPNPRRVAAYRERFTTRMPGIDNVQQALARYGYDIAQTGILDDQTRQVVSAFQMHFRPAEYNGEPDPETLARLWALNDKYRGH